MKVGGWRISLWAAIVVAALIFLYLVRGVLLPFLIAFALSAILDPIVKRLVKRGWPQPLAIGGILTLFFGSLVALGIWLTPIVSGQVVGFKERIEEFATGIARPNEDANYFVRWNPVVVERSTGQKDVIDGVLDSQAGTLERLGLPSTKRAVYAQYIEPQRGQIRKSLQNFLSGILGIASGVVSQILILLFVPILVIPILSNMDGLKRKLYSIVPPGIRGTTIALFEDIGAVFSKYLRGVTIAVLGYMALMAVVLTVLGAPFGILLGVLFGAIYLIPYLNVLIAAVTLVAVTMLDGRSRGPLFGYDAPLPFAATILVLFVGIHFVYDTIVYPRMVGRAVGLDPIVSMFVIFSGGALFGVTGMILAFPLAGSVKVILERLIGVTNRVDQVLSLPPVPERHRAATELG